MQYILSFKVKMNVEMIQDRKQTDMKIDVLFEQSLSALTEVCLSG